MNPVDAEARVVDLAQLGPTDLEARDIVAHAEAVVLRLVQDGACEGHVLMAMQVLAALRHLNRIVEQHHVQMKSVIPPASAGRTPARRRSWWIGALRLARIGAGNRSVPLRPGGIDAVGGASP